MEGFELEKGIDPEGEIGEGRGPAGGASSGSTSPSGNGEPPENSGKPANTASHAGASGEAFPPVTKTSAEERSAEGGSVGLSILLNFFEKPMRGAAAGRFFVGVRSGGSAVPGKEGRSAAAGQRSARTSENEKSFSASPSLPTVWNSHQTGTRSAIASRSPSGSRSRRR